MFAFVLAKDSSPQQRQYTRQLVCPTRRYLSDSVSAATFLSRVFVSRPSLALAIRRRTLFLLIEGTLFLVIEKTRKPWSCRFQAVIKGFRIDEDRRDTRQVAALTATVIVLFWASPGAPIDLLGTTGTALGYLAAVTVDSFLSAS